METPRELEAFRVEKKHFKNMFHPKNGALGVGFEVNPPNNAQVMKHLNTVSRGGSTFTVFMGTDLYVNLKR